jgi:hypothetical protein
MADELQAEATPGFKVGEKKTLEEYHKLGESDSLQRSVISLHRLARRSWSQRHV